MNTHNIQIKAPRGRPLYSIEGRSPFSFGYDPSEFLKFSDRTRTSSALVKLLNALHKDGCLDEHNYDIEVEKDNNSGNLTVHIRKVH